MKKILFLSIITIITFISCTKKTTTIPFSGNWSGIYKADNFTSGIWEINIDDNGNVFGIINSGPGTSQLEFGLSGNVNSEGYITFTAIISPTNKWRFDGTLDKTVANGTWKADLIIGNPINRVWNGKKR